MGPRKEGICLDDLIRLGNDQDGMRFQCSSVFRSLKQHFRA